MSGPRIRRACLRCSREVASERHMCPHGKWCRAHYAVRDVGQANACDLCPSNGMRREGPTGPIPFFTYAKNGAT